MPVSSSPPRAPPIKYTAPLGTRWAKEKAAAGGVAAFDLPTDPKNIGPWILGECVGKGASGRVKIAKHKQTGQLAAVKILPIAPLVSSRASLATQQAKSDKQRLGIDREITMMKLMNHPNIMQIYDVFEGDKELFLVLEYVEGGELFDFLVNRGRLPPSEALAYFRQIVYGLNYAHTFSIIHRDLKPENILIASISPPLIKIADWGMAAFAPPSLQLETSCGSPHYASPEIVNGEKYQGNATDIWSCGVILYALLTGRLPFDDKNVRTLLGKVKSGKYDMPTWIDPLAKDLLGRMLVVDVQRRITIPEILSHPWLLTVSSTTSGMDPSTTVICSPPLPPSPSTLARPIASPSLIDPELLSSLRVIWGRHTDPQGESIKRDLCSPIGCGVHAKAFYFLLRRYRGESMRDGLDRNGTHDNEVSNIEAESANFNLGWELDLTSVNKKYVGNRSSMLSVAPATYSRSPSPSFMPMPAFVAPSMRRDGTSISGSRVRASSPAGPRSPQSYPTGTRVEIWRTQSHGLEQKKSNPPIPGAQQNRSDVISCGGLRPPPSRRGSAHSHPLASATVSSVQFPQRSHIGDTIEKQRPGSTGGFLTSAEGAGRRMRAISPPLPNPPVILDATTTTPSQSTPAVIHAPVPVSASNHVMDMDLVIDPEPLVVDVSQPSNASSRAPDDLVKNAADQNAHGPLPPISESVASRQVGTSNYIGQRAYERRCSSRPQGGNEDKENRSIGEDGWGHVGYEEPKNGIVGLGMGRDIGRNMGNVTHLDDNSSLVKGRRDGEKKMRPPTLDFRALNQKRSTISIIGSPVALSPTNPQTNANRLLTSPVVGEFKGWFSNLFNWKTQSNSHGGVLYSSDEVSKTRADVGKLLEGFGVMVNGGGFNRGMSPGDFEGTLKCRAEELKPEVWQNSKPVRFRVEFSSSPDCNPSSVLPTQNTSHLTAPAANPYLLPSPNPGLTRTSILTSRGYMTSISNPNPGAEFPPGCISAIILVYEKGSVSSFRAVWRKLKEVYGDGFTCSPAMMSTPFVEHPRRFAV